MKFHKFVEVGRVAFGTNGPAKGKIFAIVDIIDYNRVLVDGPLSNVTRQEYRLKDLKLTSFKVNIQHSQHSKHVSAAWRKAKITKMWNNSKWNQSLEKKKLRANLNDFERFQVLRLKRARNGLIKKSVDFEAKRKKDTKKKVVEKRQKQRKIKSLMKDPVKWKALVRKNFIFKRMRLANKIKPKKKTAVAPPKKAAKATKAKPAETKKTAAKKTVTKKVEKTTKPTTTKATKPVAKKEKTSKPVAKKTTKATKASAK